MMTARKAYEIATEITQEFETWEYLEERVEWHAKNGRSQMTVSFSHNPQTALHMMRELGYTVTPDKIDQAACYYSFIISWF